MEEGLLLSYHKQIDSLFHDHFIIVFGNKCAIYIKKVLTCIQGKVLEISIEVGLNLPNLLSKIMAC